MEQNDLLNERTCENTIREFCKERTHNHANDSEICEKKIEWKPFLRQVLVCSSVWVSYFMLGLSMGAPTVFIPQIKKEANSTNVIDQEMTSWLSSLIPYSGMLGSFILPALSQLAGRRMTFLILASSSLVGFIIFLVSTTIRDLLLSLAMYGLLVTSSYTILPIIVTEYTSPRYRGIFLTLKTASFYWGIWASNAIGTFFYWKNIGYFGICCNIFVFITGFCWYESPYWLATKGRYKECIESHRKLKGCSSDAEKELQELLDSQKYDSLEITSDNPNSKLWKCRLVENFIKTMRDEQYYKPTLVSLLLVLLYQSSGKMACTIYAIELIKKITDSESTAYKGMLILDGVTVFGMYMGCISSRFLKRRTLMLCCSTSGVFFLLILSLYLYLIKQGVIAESSVMSILLLTFYQLSISCGPIMLASSMYSEMAPTKYMSYSMFAMGFFTGFVMATVIKNSPLIFVKLGLHNAFLIYGICGGICTIFVYKYLPETKDKTIHEISEYFKTSRKEAKELISRTRYNRNKIDKSEEQM
ncbi:facilitated trehalose transporter Tret1-like [Epargyreus clarus]|uniref:facilitated trehalose transporter Tret1-like n=1 Tax=Epargyreus clarus TaxID=520877 RepID=UPI003C2CB989